MTKLGFHPFPAAAALLLAVTACGPGAGSAPSSSAPAPVPTSAPVSTPATAKPTTPAPPRTTATASPVRQCTTAALRISLGRWEGALGHRYVPVVFTNVGAPCRITGHPGVSYYGGTDHHQVGEAAVRDPGPRAVLLLHRGESATAWVDQVNVYLYEPEQCGPVPVTGLRVHPPGSTTAVLLPETGANACTKHMPGQRTLGVRAVERSTDTP